MGFQLLPVQGLDGPGDLSLFPNASSADLDEALAFQTRQICPLDLHEHEGLPGAFTSCSTDRAASQIGLDQVAGVPVSYTRWLAMTPPVNVV
ncbi:MAG: hypothetical protein U0231_16690 [Nitrospiraceae bacterium]